MRYQAFLAELKRRQVFKVMAVYGAVAFVVVQAADIVFPRLGLPDWTITFIVAVTVIGFPIAVVLAWAFELTPEGVKRTDAAAAGELEAIAAQPRGRRWPAGILALAATILLVGGIWWTAGRGGAGSSDSDEAAEPRAASIAVLPFVNLSREEENEYFGDGLAEELLNALNRLPGLKVAARTSAFAFKGRNLDVRQIGDTLDVSTVLEGSVRRSGERVRITAQLVNVSDGFHLWSESYDRELTDIFAIQEEIARSIAAALEVRLGGGPGPLVQTTTPDIDAYTHYLRGRHLWYQRTLRGLYAAVDQFKQAIALDPDYARAYAGLADTYLLLPEYGGPSIPEIHAEAKAATERALALDPNSAQAYTASAYFKFRFEWDWKGAEQDFMKAIELSPEYATAHQWYSELLGVLRRREEALDRIRRAYELDPLAPAVNAVLGVHLMANGLTDEAVARFKRTLEIAPGYSLVAYQLAVAYVQKGDLSAAAAAFDTVAEITDTDPAPYRAFVAALSDSKQIPAAVAALEASPVYGVLDHADYLAQLGLVDETLAVLERAYQERRPYLPGANAWLQFEGLRADSRFRDFLRKLGL